MRLCFVVDMFMCALGSLFMLPLFLGFADDTQSYAHTFANTENARIFGKPEVKTIKRLNIRCARFKDIFSPPRTSAEVRRIKRLFPGVLLPLRPRRFRICGLAASC